MDRESAGTLFGEQIAKASNEITEEIKTIEL